MVSSVGSSSILTSSSTSLYSTPATTASASANSVLNSTSAQLSEIEKQLAEYAAEAAKQRKKDEAQSKVQVETFEKTVRKSPYSTNGAATDIGTLVKDTTRLNVYSALNKGDKGDVFKLRVQSAGDAQIGFLGDEGLRIQVMTRYGSVVADSKEGQGKASREYEALLKGEMKLAAGDYYVKVTHDGAETVKDASGATKTSKNYALQFSQGIYRKDYDTIAQQPKAGDGMPQQSAAQIELVSMLTAAQSFDIGASGTTKLSNVLFG